MTGDGSFIAAWLTAALAGKIRGKARLLTVALSPLLFSLRGPLHDFQCHVVLLMRVTQSGFASQFHGVLECRCICVIRVPFALSELRAIVRGAHVRADAAGGSHYGSL